MNWCAENVRTALNATLNVDDEAGSHLFLFDGTRTKYALCIYDTNNFAMLSADPIEPIQPCPLLEFTFPCDFAVVGESAYGGDHGLAVRFYKDCVDHCKLRLVLTPVGNGDWYIWANSDSQLG